MCGSRCDDGSNHTGSYGGENEVSIDFAPLIPAGRAAQVIVPIVDPLAAVPIFMAHMLAFSPFIMTNILLMVFVVVIAVAIVMAILREQGSG